MRKILAAVALVSLAGACRSGGSEPRLFGGQIVQVNSHGATTGLDTAKGGAVFYADYTPAAGADPFGELFFGNVAIGSCAPLALSTASTNTHTTLDVGPTVTLTHASAVDLLLRGTQGSEIGYQTSGGSIAIATGDYRIRWDVEISGNATDVAPESFPAALPQPGSAALSAPITTSGNFVLSTAGTLVSWTPMGSDRVIATVTDNAYTTGIACVMADAGSFEIPSGDLANAPPTGVFQFYGEAEGANLGVDGRSVRVIGLSLTNGSYVKQ